MADGCARFRWYAAALAHGLKSNSVLGWRSSPMITRAPEQRDRHSPNGAVELTVVIPHFNQSHILPRAVASVLAEGVSDTEIIIVDDGSTDGGEDILRALERADPSIYVIRNTKNKGAPTALNTGLAAARGRYVSFLGADDCVLPGFCRVMVAALERYPEAALACGEVAIISKQSVVNGIRPLTVPAMNEAYLTPAMVRRRIARTDNWICNTVAVHRTEMIRAASGFDPTLGSFCDGFLCRTLAFTHGFVFVPGVYGVWQVSSDSLSASSVLDRRESARLVALAEERLRDSIIGRRAPEYPSLFARRLRFGAARMHFVWSGSDAQPANITEAAHGNERDLRLLRAIKQRIGFGRLGRALALGWLAVRLRPFAPGSLAVNLMRNHWVLRRNRHRIQERLRYLDALGVKLIAERNPVAENAEIGLQTLH
jgi:glycosyltransferase involved in cell wall biosynthesis